MQSSQKNSHLLHWISSQRKLLMSSRSTAWASAPSLQALRPLCHGQLGYPFTSFDALQESAEKMNGSIGKNNWWFHRLGAQVSSSTPWASPFVPHKNTSDKCRLSNPNTYFQRLLHMGTLSSSSSSGFNSSCFKKAESTATQVWECGNARRHWRKSSSSESNALGCSCSRVGFEHQPLDFDATQLVHS